jgi:hypothetical protein
MKVALKQSQRGKCRTLLVWNLVHKMNIVIVVVFLQAVLNVKPSMLEMTSYSSTYCHSPLLERLWLMLLELVVLVPVADVLLLLSVVDSQ